MKKKTWKDKEFLKFISNTHIFIITMIIAIIFSFYVLKTQGATP